MGPFHCGAKCDLPSAPTQVDSISFNSTLRLVLPDFLMSHEGGEYKGRSAKISALCGERQNGSGSPHSAPGATSIHRETYASRDLPQRRTPCKAGTFPAIRQEPLTYYFPTLGKSEPGRPSPQKMADLQVFPCTFRSLDSDILWYSAVSGAGAFMVR
jgi:hypothetical protein